MKNLNNIKLIILLIIIFSFFVGCDDNAPTDNRLNNNTIVIERLVDENSNWIPVMETEPSNGSEISVEDLQLIEGEFLESQKPSESNQELPDKASINEEQTISENTYVNNADIIEGVADDENNLSYDSPVGIISDITEEIDASVTPASSCLVPLDMSWKYADYSAIHSGSAVMYRASDNRKNIVIGVNAGHGTKGGSSAQTYSHPDMTPKVTGGTTAAGSVKSTAVSGGMSFIDGTSEASVTLREAQILRDKLLIHGYDVLMIRDSSDVQLDNVARTVICNNNANCHIAIHWDGDNLNYDKGCFYISTPEGIKYMEPVASTWTRSEALGQSLISGLKSVGCKIYSGGSMAVDLTQTSYSTIPSVDIELGNAASNHDDTTLAILADGLCMGIDAYYY